MNLCPLPVLLLWLMLKGSKGKPWRKMPRMIITLSRLCGSIVTSVTLLVSQGHGFVVPTWAQAHHRQRIRAQVAVATNRSHDCFVVHQLSPKICWSNDESSQGWKIQRSFVHQLRCLIVRWDHHPTPVGVITQA